MKWLIIPALLALAACSGTRALQASKEVPYATLVQTVQVGSSQEQVRSLLGDSTAISFDSGNSVWMYTYLEPSGAKGEYVIWFSPDGLVRKVRSGVVYQVKN